MNDRPDIIAHPPLIVGGMIVAGYMVGLIIGGSFSSNLQTMGWILIITGLAIACLGAWEFNKAGTNIVPHKPALKLATGGIYRLTRNPMYIGLLSVHAGLALVVSSYGILISWLGSALLLHFGVVLKEEQYLTSKFGSDYIDYMNSSRRWLLG